eukprot:CAMPEP_0172509622 /NCGR_PEP_ID=MMETSP1066-20121228/221738_1 /TAXON_ID=671091 /ORGANISM="Coscinodiscus wailesii, Strain CCMP2513" /LENGTH=284 /DNA_ID=CAMNT_0013288201 /DNA_START=145 /DNA_END=999 /DNA_ORIENTATION=-
MASSRVTRQPQIKRTNFEGVATKHNGNARRSPPQITPNSSSGVTSNLISYLAVAALKLRRKDQTSVKCFVNSSPSEIIRGRLEKATVTGKGWSSPLGLTCRAIEATVTNCELDMGKVLSKRKLHLVIPAKGDAMIAMNNFDFGSFITHPLLKAPQHKFLGELRDFEFLKDDVSINPVNKSVQFYGVFLGEKWKCSLERPTNGGANVIVSPTNLSSRMLDEDMVPALSTELSRLITDFFTRLEFNLDGTILSFRDMMLTSKGASPNIMFALKITVKKFPSPGLAF